MPYADKADKAANNKLWRERNLEKARAIRRAYYLRHKKQEQEANRRYWVANKERLNGIQRQSYHANLEASRQRGRMFAKTHRSQRNAAWHKYRSRKEAAHGSFTLQGWIQKCQYYGWHCVYCTTDLNQNTVTIDHYKPLSKGGSNWLSNLVPACKSCNSKKNNKHLPISIHLLAPTSKE